MVLIDDLYHNLPTPSWIFRTTSYQLILATASIGHAFLYGLNKTTVHGGEKFVELLVSRSDHKQRRRGLITVSNHTSVIDDPFIWGCLPFSFAAVHGYQNHRFSLASHDLCFQSSFLSNFFILGQVLPTHRIKHSPHGGLFQPTMTEAVRLLTRIDAGRMSWNPHNRTLPGYTQNLTSTGPSHPDGPPPSWPSSALDPASPLKPFAPAYPSYPNDVRAYNAPSRYASNSYSWVHIFPEGFVHQSDPKERYMRYFKWGVSRLILEPPEVPDFVPMFIEGLDQCMHESREFPRFLPRINKEIHISFGDPVNMEERFGDLRKRWRELVDQENKKTINKADIRALASHPQFAGLRNKIGYDGQRVDEARVEKMELDYLYNTTLGVIPQSLKYNEEVVELRKECTRRVREEVLKVRRGRGYPDEDPKAGLVETWHLEGPKREGKMEDGTWVKEA